MQAVILAGGYGTRISEETVSRPKPMIEIGGMPILWHIMKTYSTYGIQDFIICLGYKGYLIKEYFQNYFLHMSDVTFDMRTNKIQVHQNSSEPWTVTLLETGEATMTGGRVLRVAKYIKEENFCLTYGDGVADIDIKKLVEFHLNHGREATLTAVQPPGRFGALRLTGTIIEAFEEKPNGDGGWINGGYFVLSKKVLSRIHGDNTLWEKEPLVSLARDGQLEAYLHQGFWHPMDTLRDKNYLEELWTNRIAPWKVW